MKLKNLAGITTIFAIVTVFVGLIFLEPTSGVVPDLIVAEVKNDVKIRKASSAIWQGARVSMVLSMGDSIKTGKDSFATLRFSYPKENSFQLYENTEVTVAELVKGKDVSLKKVNMKMLKGGTWAKLSGVASKDYRFKVTTPNTVAAISGTSLAVIVYSEEETYFCACDGVIDIGNPGKSVTIKRAQGSTVKGDAAPTRPVSDKHIVTEKKYEKDPRYAWCIHCHSTMTTGCGPAPEPEIGLFPGCAKKTGKH